MPIKIHPIPTLSGNYDLHRLERATLNGASSAQVGLVRIGAGTRSPSAGFGVSARHEIAFVVEGQIRVDTAERSQLANPHDIIVSSPTEMHATTALTDATLFFVLIDPP
jgi:quercetin dioxygenase-like cupin family protein